MSREREHPPSEWDVGAYRISDDIYVRPRNPETVDDLIVWHWCTTDSRWNAATVGLHTLVKADPLHLEASLLMSNCCGLHGWIRNGEWVGV